MYYCKGDDDNNFNLIMIFKTILSTATLFNILKFGLRKLNKVVYLPITFFLVSTMRFALLKSDIFNKIAFCSDNKLKRCIGWTMRRRSEASTPISLSSDKNEIVSFNCFFTTSIVVQIFPLYTAQVYFKLPFSYF